jgi:hypothetical protein
MVNHEEFDNLDILIRKRNGRYVAAIPQLGLYGAGDTIEAAATELRSKKAALLKEYADVGLIDTLKASNMIWPHEMRRSKREYLGFALKSMILVFVLVVGVTIGIKYILADAAHRAQQFIETVATQQRGISGKRFWKILESNVEKAADQKNELPEAEKQKILTELHILAIRWRPYVQELSKLFEDSDESGRQH